MDGLFADFVPSQEYAESGLDSPTESSAMPHGCCDYGLDTAALVSISSRFT